MAFLVKTLLVLLASSLLCQITHAVRTQCTPYKLYWEEYNGPPIDEDAILAGTVRREDGSTAQVYVGQVYMPQVGLEPVAVYNDTNAVWSTYHKVVKEHTQYVRVLGSNARNLDNVVVWVPVDIAPQLELKDFIVAGYEKNFSIYFGRSQQGDNVIAGKVWARKDNTFKLYYPEDGKEKKLNDNFEVLAYSQARKYLKQKLT